MRSDSLAEMAAGTSADARRQPPAMTGKALQLAASLQKTLELESLLESFASEVAQTVAFDGLLYRHEAHEVEHEYGWAGDHQCQYDLKVNNEALGEMVFTRTRPFSEAELVLIEHLIGALVYPLRNALMYREASMAALRDPLTGTYNRTMLHRTMERESRLAQRHDMPLSAVMMDLDQFKSVNDTYGHVAGDRLLQNLVDCLQDIVRGSDMMARYGGDEFAVLLSNTSISGAMTLAERIRLCVEEGNRSLLPEAQTPITASLGVASLSQCGEEGLVNAADEALLKAKRAGGNRVMSYGE